MNGKNTVPRVTARHKVLLALLMEALRRDVEACGLGARALSRAHIQIALHDDDGYLIHVLTRLAERRLRISTERPVSTTSRAQPHRLRQRRGANVSPGRDAFGEFLEAAGEAQVRMQVERGLSLIERYLACHAEFAAWCRANLQHLVDDPPVPCDRSD